MVKSMDHDQIGKISLIAFVVYSATILGVNIPLKPDKTSPTWAAPLSMPLWVIPVTLSVAWLLEGFKPEALQIKRTSIYLAPSGCLIPLAMAAFFGFQLMYLTPFLIGVLIMAGLMFKLSKPDFLKGTIRFKFSYALVLSYGAAALAALLMYGTADIALNVSILAPLAGSVGTVGILLGNIATALELSSQTATPATFKQRIILGSNGVRDVLWSPLLVAVVLFTIPTMLQMLT
jgi:hypothetical protein